MKFSGRNFGKGGYDFWCGFIELVKDGFIGDVVLVDGGLDLVGLSGPPARPEPQIVGEGAEAVPELVRRLRQEVKVL